MPKSKDIPFRTRLVEARESRGLSQRALARKAGLTQQAVNLLEAGKRLPTMETVRKLACALEMGPETFF